MWRSIIINRHIHKNADAIAPAFNLTFSKTTNQSEALHTLDPSTVQLDVDSGEKLGASASISKCEVITPSNFT
ncbi:hypothetical protein [Brevibacillus laterosporus]|uniref:hypothetical protein n=1 Tax=Brevibacillus laterosporus TaxID=1465 RepID=UPI001153D46E|nr:hypothetical protein [Brevibacillus laterosporus]MCR8994198.1 hypothetical protein [Brevibacillus laterosporus]